MTTPETNNRSAIKWYTIACSFFAGVFLINVLPHFINGITGHYFPTPFANPPGVGLSSPVLNMVWASLNLAIGSLLLYVGRVVRQPLWVWLVFAVGGLLMAFYVASYFGSVMNPA